MADRSVNGRRTTHRWCLVLLVTMSFVLAASAPAARAERFNLAPGQAHTSVSKPGTDGTERRGGTPVQTRSPCPREARRSPRPRSSPARNTGSWPGTRSGRPTRTAPARTTGSSFTRCSPFPSQCEPLHTGGIPERDLEDLGVRQDPSDVAPWRGLRQRRPVRVARLLRRPRLPLTITSADGRLTITDAFPSFGYSTAGETGSWKLDTDPSDAAFGELPDPGFYYPPRGTRDSKEVAATLEGSKARLSFVGSKCSSHNVNFDYSLGVLHAKPVRVNRTTGKFSDTVGAVSENGSRDDKWVEAKFTGRFFPRQVRGTLKLTVDSKKKPKCEPSGTSLPRLRGEPRRPRRSLRPLNPPGSRRHYTSRRQRLFPGALP